MTHPSARETESAGLANVARNPAVLWVPGGATTAVGPDGLAAALDDVDVFEVETLDDANERMRDVGADVAVVGGTPTPVETLERLRSVGVQTPVVLVVGGGTTSVGGGALDLGATVFVPGGDDPTASLAATVRGALDRGTHASMPIQSLPSGEQLRLKERAMDEAPIGITVADMTQPDDPLVYANEGFEEMTGYDIEEAIGRNCRFLQGPETDPETVAELRKAIDAGEPATVELRNYRKDGEQFWNRLRLSPLSEDGEVTKYVGFQTDVTARKQAELARRRETERLDHLVGRLRGLVVDTTELLTAADSSSTILRDVAARFGDDEAYALAWTGEYVPATERVEPVGVDGEAAPTDPPPVDLAESTPASRAIARAVASGEPVVTDEAVAELSFDADGLPPEPSAAVVPLVYRGTVYGVLTVVGSRVTFEGPERDVLAALGQSIGSAIHSVGSRRLLTTDAVVEVTVRLSTPEVFPVGLSADTGCRLTYETGRFDDEDGFVGVFSLHGEDAESVVDTAVEDDRVTAAETLATADGDAVVQFRLADAPLVRLLSAHGAHLQAFVVTAGEAELTFEVAESVAARALVERLENLYDATLVSYHGDRERGPTAKEFRSVVEEQLTDQQRTALRRAYAGGFFEWPREINGERLAEAMDISPPTFHQHLRSAERKVFSELLD